MNLIARNSQVGYSLIELLVAMSITLVLGLIAAPNMGILFAEYQLISGSNQVEFDITRARMQAVAQNRFVRIKMLSGTQYARETSTDLVTWSNRVTTTLPTGVTSTTTSAEIRFDKGGYPTVNDSVSLTNSIYQRKTLATNPIGRVTLANS